MSNFLRKDKFLVFLLFILALLPRIISAVCSDQILRGDEIDYSQLAVRILEGRPYHSNFPLGFTNARAPLYPLFIAVIYFFSGKSVLALKLVQAILGAFTCIMVFFISKALFNNKRISFGAGFVCAIYPLFISINASLASETLFTFLLALAILFLLKVYDCPRLKNKFLSGLFLGLTALTKPVILTFVPFLFLWLILFQSRNLLLRFKSAIVIMLFFALTILPWIIRNYVVFKEFVPISTAGGVTFYIYNNESTLAKIYDPVMFVGTTPLSEEQKKELSLLSEPERDKYLYRLGLKFAQTHPKDFLKIRLISLGQFWHFWPEPPARYKEYYAKKGAYRSHLLDKLVETNILYLVKILYHLVYDMFFLGMFLSPMTSVRKRDEFKRSVLLILLILSMSLLYSIHGTDRYRIPTDPYVFLLGLHGILSIWNKR